MTVRQAERTATSRPRAVRGRGPADPRGSSWSGPAAARVTIVSGSVGAGHDGVARELAARLRAGGIEVTVLDHLAFLPRAAQHVLRDGYTATVNRVPALFDWIFQRLEDSRLMLGAADLLCRVAGRRLGAALAGADVVVSTYPLASRSLGQLVDRGRLDVPTVTYLTDPAPHRTWVHPSVDLHLTVTAATAAVGRRQYGVAMAAAGPLVPPAFSSPVRRLQRQRLRNELGLAPTDIGVLLSSGSLGLGELGAAAEEVRASGAIPIVLCGSNTALRARLTGDGVTALGWRDDVPALMGACDVLVHNAGGLSLTEALAAGLPAVTYAPIPGHGRANAKVLDDAGLAPWARDRHQLGMLIQQAAERRRVPLPAPAVPAAEAIGQLAWAECERRIPSGTLLTGEAV